MPTSWPVTVLSHTPLAASINFDNSAAEIVAETTKKEYEPVYANARNSCALTAWRPICHFCSVSESSGVTVNERL
jgi:hypothetical protein